MKRLVTGNELNRARLIALANTQSEIVKVPGARARRIYGEELHHFAGIQRGVCFICWKGSVSYPIFQCFCGHVVYQVNTVVDPWADPWRGEWIDAGSLNNDLFVTTHSDPVGPGIMVLPASPGTGRMYPGFVGWALGMNALIQK